MSYATEPQTHGTGLLPVFKKILFVTDFSSCSEAAAPFARWLAESYGASLSAAHVIPGDLVDAPSEAVYGTAQEIAEVTRRNMTAFLERSGLANADVLITAGTVWESLAAIIERERVDLVVVGTHGRSGVGKLLLGSIAQRIFNVVPCPVLTVSPRARLSGREAKLRKVLYATDLSEQSLQALPYARSVCRTTGHALLVLHVSGGGEHDAADVEQRLESAVAGSASLGITAEKVVAEGDPAHVIVQTAAERGADLIVIGARKIEEGPLYRVNVPLTTAYQVVAHAHCPVLRVRG